MEGASNKVEDHDDEDYLPELPPGFRFHPTDEEIISHYLTHKVMNKNFSARAIGQVDLNKCEPWDLPKKAKMGGKEWYFFFRRDKKYPTGTRTNRATESGYWKATGKDKEIYKGKKQGYCGDLVGMKKTLVFYIGRAPKGEKSNWVMHEFRLEGKFSYSNFPRAATKDEWVVCRIFHKNTTGTTRTPSPSPNTTSGHLMRINSTRTLFDEYNDILLDFPHNSLPPLLHIDPKDDYKETPQSSSFTTLSPMINDQQEDHNNHHHHHHHHSTSFLNIPFMINNYNPNAFPSPTFPFKSSSINHYHDDHLYQDRIGSTASIPSFTGKGGSCFNEITSTHNTDQSMLRAQAERPYYCKLEQPTVSLSQDTGISTDLTTEISSSVISNHEMGIGNASFGPISDLDPFWN